MQPDIFPIKKLLSSKKIISQITSFNLRLLRKLRLG